MRYDMIHTRLVCMFMHTFTYYNYIHMFNVKHPSKGNYGYT